jgi:hypothetical protein
VEERVRVRRLRSVRRPLRGSDLLTPTRPDPLLHADVEERE